MPPLAAGATLEAAHLQAVITRAPLILFELDPEGRFTLSEGSALENLGLRPGEAVGRSLFDLYAARPDILAGARRALAGETVRQEIAVAGRVFAVTYTPSLAADGRLRRVVGVAHDVTELHRSAAALERSEARYRDFTKASSDWQWETDRGHRFVAFSARVEEVLGVSSERMPGLRRVDRATGDPADGDWQAHLEALDRCEPFRDFTYGIRDAEGRRRVVRVSGRPVFDASGAFLGYRGTGREVTAEVEAVERLCQSEERFRSLVENLRGILFARSPAGDGSDDPAIEVYGRDAPALVGAELAAGRAGLARWIELLDPEHREACRTAQAERRRRGRPFTLEFRLRHPETGELRWMREVAWVIEDAESGRTWFDSYILDVTEEKRAAAARRASEERHRRLVEGAPVAILIYREQRCIYANAAAQRLLGAKAPAQLLGSPLAELVQASARARLARLAAASARGRGAAPARELAFRRLDGRTVSVAASAAAVLEAGEPALQLASVDLTACKRAETALRRVAHRDALTGLPNRLTLMERLEGATARVRRRRFALMVLDLDGFEEVNDTLGHAAGDELLREVARRVRRVLRVDDTLARLGGDEFAVPLPGASGAGTAAQLATRVIEPLAQSCPWWRRARA